MNIHSKYPVNLFRCLSHVYYGGVLGQSNKFALYLPDRSIWVLLLWMIHVISVVYLLCFSARLFIVALWSPDGIGLTSCLSFMMSNCMFVTFPLVSWVRCGNLVVLIPGLCPLFLF